MTDKEIIAALREQIRQDRETAAEELQRVRKRLNAKRHEAIAERDEVLTQFSELLEPLTAERIWFCIDQMAKRHGYSPSGLATKAGLDPTTLNVGRRILYTTKEPRWPSLRTIAELLKVTGETPLQFFSGVVPNDDD